MESKPHSFITGVFDFYVAFFALGSLGAVYTAIAGKPLSLTIGLMSIPAVLLLLLVYYPLISKRIQWLSPGEIMTGRAVRAGEKVWRILIARTGPSCLSRCS